MAWQELQPQSNCITDLAEWQVLMVITLVSHINIIDVTQMDNEGPIETGRSTASFHPIRWNWGMMLDILESMDIDAYGGWASA